MAPYSGDDALASLLRASWQASAGASLVAGVAVHHTVFRCYEIDGYAWQLVFVHLGAMAALLASYIQTGEHQLASALFRVLVVANAYFVGVASSILLYRALFHPLHRFPGPFGAKLTRFYSMRTAIKSMKNYEDVQRLHRVYGDIVRVGPRELSINKQSAIQAIYGAQVHTTRSPFYIQASRDANKSSLIHTRIPAVHKLRKKAWERGLGPRALDIYEPRMRAKVDLLLSKIEASGGSPFDVTKYSMFLSFDVMADAGFSKDFHMLESASKHPAIQGIHDITTFTGILGKVPWLIYMIGSIPGLTSYNRFNIWCHDQLKEKRKALDRQKQTLKDQYPQDVMSWLLKAMDEGDPSAPPGDLAIQEDSRVMIVAGSDTTAAVLANVLFYLASNPHCYKRLQELVQEQFPGGVGDWTYEKAKAIPYIDYLAYETLRLKPPGPGNVPREVPPQGLMIDGEFIPGGTIAAVPTYTIQRDERYWPEPLAFKPERWEGLSTERTAFIPFNRGPWVCPGKNFAMMQLRMVLSRIALQYDVAFAVGQSAEAFERDTKVTLLLTMPELFLSFTPKRA